MNKRTRKKKHLGEFQELGSELSITLATGICFDEFLDHFIDHAIESNGFSFGGGGNRSKPIVTGFVELGIRNKAVANHNRLQQWLQTDSNVAKFDLGKLRDINYGWD